MGRIYISTLAEVAQRGVVLLVECPCGRKRWMGPADLIGRKVDGQMVRSYHNYADIARHLRCKVCNRRGVSIRALYPSEIGVPQGVAVLPFLQADDRERKRMVRQARG